LTASRQVSGYDGRLIDAREGTLVPAVYFAPIVRNCQKTPGLPPPV
jgi:hypothetical protein